MSRIENPYCIKLFEVLEDKEADKSDSEDDLFGE